MGSALRCGEGRCYDYKAAIPGEGSASGGKATYNIKIEVPPGRDGMQPNISLDYSSKGGNSTTGMGWQLAEGGAVFRCAALPAYEGYTEGPSYSITDRLCIDGWHLIPVSGEYGHSGTVYREIFDQFIRVQEFGDLDDPAAYFVATYQSGVKRVFKDGNVLQGAKLPLTWFLTYEEDTTGNTVSYSYISPSPGDKLISEIRYTGRERDGKIEPGSRWVRFNYEDRPDSFGFFNSGGRTIVDQRLASVVTGIDVTDAGNTTSEPILDYGLSYKQSLLTGDSLISAIRECTRDKEGNRYCRPPTTFDWSDGPLQYRDPERYSAPALDQGDRTEWHAGLVPVVRAPYIVSNDYDDDGRKDVLFYKPGTPSHLLFFDIHGRLSHDIDLTPYIESPNPQWVSSMGPDIRNNGGADVVGKEHDRFTVATWDGHSIGKPTVMDLPYSDDFVFAEFGGAGTADLLESTIEGSDYVIRYYANGDSSPSKIDYRKPVEILRMPVPASTAGKYWMKSAGDLDENGVVDVFLMQGDLIKKILLFHNIADGVSQVDMRDPPSYGISDHLQQEGFLFADIDGDGVPDIVYSEAEHGSVPTWHYQLNTHAGFSAPVDTGVPDSRGPTARHSTLVADITVDGKDSLLYPDTVLVDYCLPVKESTPPESPYECSSDGLQRDHPELDFGIYRFSALQFFMDRNGRLTPRAIGGTNIVAQANLTSVGDLQGDGFPNILSPFDPWFSNGRFRDHGGSFDECPEHFGCGLRVTSPVATQRDDRMDAAPDMMVKADHGDGRWESWDYYPITSVVPGLYSFPSLESPDRYIDRYDYYFSTSMYVVGTFYQDAGTIGSEKFEYGGAVWDDDTAAFAGFHWIIVHPQGTNTKYAAWFDTGSHFADGELIKSWSEPESANDDDYLHDIPSRHLIQKTVNTIDCQGPPGSANSKKWGCVDSGSLTYHVRRRSETTARQNVATKKEIITGLNTYDYDLFGHQTCAAVQDDQGNVQVTIRRYAPPDLDGWWIDKLLNERVVSPIHPANCLDHSLERTALDGRQTEMTYEYNDQRNIKKKTEIQYEDEVETKVEESYEYVEDPDSPSYGEIKVKTVESLDGEGNVEDSFRQEFGYSPDGYFTTSVYEPGIGTATYEYDPSTGDLLRATRADGSIVINEYDVFGAKIKSMSNKVKTTASVP